MSEKALRVLVGTLAGLALLYGLVLLTTRRSSSVGVADGRLAAILERIEPESVASVTIRGPTTALELGRSDGGWTVSGYPADTAAVARLWRAVEEAAVGSVVATNPANHERLGVSEDSAWVVTFRNDGGGADTVLIGKSGTQFGSAYGRATGDDAVVTIRGDVRGAVARDLTDWRDKTIATVDTAAVQSVSISRSGSAVTLAREAGTWRVGDQAADSLTVQDLLRELAGLRATGFAPDTASVPDEDRRSLLLATAAGDTLASIVFGEREGQFLVQATPGGTVFRLPRWRVDRLTPEQDALAADPIG